MSTPTKSAITNIPSWFEDKGYWLSIGKINLLGYGVVVLYHKELSYSMFYSSNSTEVMRWNYAPSLSTVTEVAKEFEEKHKCISR